MTADVGTDAGLTFELRELPAADVLYADETLPEEASLEAAWARLGERDRRILMGMVRQTGVIERGHGAAAAEAALLEVIALLARSGSGDAAV